MMRLDLVVGVRKRQSYMYFGYAQQPKMYGEEISPVSKNAVVKVPRL
jgi:hypothetical protein